MYTSGGKQVFLGPFNTQKDALSVQPWPVYSTVVADPERSEHLSQLKCSVWFRWCWPTTVLGTDEDEAVRSVLLVMYCLSVL